MTRRRAGVKDNRLDLAHFDSSKRQISRHSRTPNGGAAMIARVVELILFGLMPFLAGSMVAGSTELIEDDPVAEVRSIDIQPMMDPEMAEHEGSAPAQRK
jgi:hypothetical protein